MVDHPDGLTLDSTDAIFHSRLMGDGPPGRLPLEPGDLLHRPSGYVFGLTQNAGMGWKPEELKRKEFLILSTQGGLRATDGTPLALGYHTGHWELDELVRVAAESIRSQGALPYAAYCSDPCDGRTQGTPGMMDSLPYRNDAAITLRRLARSLPTRRGLLGIATCDKGLPAMMMALAGLSQFPSVLVPGGVTLPARDTEDAGTVQSVGARFAQDEISLEYASTVACRACGSPGGGCQFLGTAATCQVVAEALGMAIVHSALAPSGEPVWRELAQRSAITLLRLEALEIRMSDILTPEAVENAMIVHAAFGGSTNLLLHLPAVAHAAQLRIPSVSDWMAASRATPRIVDCLPNGPRNFPTVAVYMAGAVPEVMLELRRCGLLNTNVMTANGCTLEVLLDRWEKGKRRWAARQHLKATLGIDPDDVILSSATGVKRGLGRTLVFPVGNLAPEGSVIKATAIDPSLIEDDVYRHTGPARVFTSEQSAIQAIKGQSENPLKPGDVLVLIGIGPAGTGMEEIYQITSALKFLPWGKQIAVLTDGRFSGVSTGACIGHIGPEALAGGPLGKLQDGDLIRIVVNREDLTGTIDYVGTRDAELPAQRAVEVLNQRPPHPKLKPRPDLPADTRLWAALQRTSGGTWNGAVYDPDRIIARLLQD